MQTSQKHSMNATLYERNKSNFNSWCMHELYGLCNCFKEVFPKVGSTKSVEQQLEFCKKVSEFEHVKLYRRNTVGDIKANIKNLNVKKSKALLAQKILNK